MGMGEPLDNFETVIDAVHVLNCHWGLNFSRRKVTISTAGLVPLIPSLADERVRLAVSLNATTDELRSKIMPINKKYPLHELLKACKTYTKKSKDKVTFEYVLLKGINDSLADAKRLRRITKDIPCKINLIAFNEHPETDLKRPSDETVIQFQKALIDLGAHVLLRKSMGRDIFAACGQLRSQHEVTKVLE
jgi:23S rRNA (adenine2503-C2)-methyltransferase